MNLANVFLVLTALLFFGLSWVYEWGLWRFFKYNFNWALAAVTGILFVSVATFAFVWFWRGIPITALIDLAIVFYAALPGMLKSGLRFRNWMQELYEENEALKSELDKINGQEEELDKQQAKLDKIQILAEQALQDRADMKRLLGDILELAQLSQMRDEAQKILRGRSIN